MRAWLETFPPIERFSITADEILGCEDLAFVRGRYEVTIALDAGSTPATDRGHYMGLLRMHYPSARSGFRLFQQRLR